MAETVGEARRDIHATRGQLADTVEELERKLDVREQVTRRPWPVLAAAMGAGFLLAGGARRTDRRERAMRDEPELRAGRLAETYAASQAAPYAASQAAPYAAPRGRTARVMDDVMDTVSSGVKDVVRAGVQALAGELRTALVASLAGAAGATVTRRHAESQHGEPDRAPSDGAVTGRRAATTEWQADRPVVAARADRAD